MSVLRFRGRYEGQTQYVFYAAHDGKGGLDARGVTLLEEGGDGLTQAFHYLFGAVVVARGGQIDHT